MCSGDSDYLADPERRLAALLKVETGVVIDPAALRMFIRAKWERVSVLAHRIHEAK